MINLFDHKGILFEMTGPSGEIEIKHCILIFILKERPYTVPLLTSHSIKISQDRRRHSATNLLIKLLHCRLQ